MKKKILVVEDSSYLREVIKKELEEDYEVKLAVDGLQALTMLEKFRPELVTLDIEMPRLNGFETFKKLYSPHYSRFFSHVKDKRVPVIFVTSNDNFEDRKTGFDLGAADFITKPFLKGDLLEIVNKILKPDNSLQGLRVLIVEDNEATRNIVAEFLNRSGVTIILAEHGKEAYEIVCKQMEDIDLIITDLVMPEMSGGDLCKKIRNELGLKDLPIIFMTGIDNKEDLLKVFKAGGTDYIMKPFIKEELLARVVVQMEKTQLLKRMKNAYFELRSYTKMKDELMAVCSHDLRAPLNNILGFSKLLMDNKKMGVTELESLGYIKESGDILLNLINDILDLSKFQSKEIELEMNSLSMIDIIQMSINAFSQMIDEKKLKIEFSNKSSSTLINGNINGLMRTFNNLLSNAIKFTPEAGLIKITLEDGKEDKIDLSITDTGIGIEEDQIPKLFDKFTRLSKSGTGGEKGTGLGMAIVKEIVEKHNGDIKVTSVLNEGTTFTVSLPKLPKFKASENSENVISKNFM